MSQKRREAQQLRYYNTNFREPLESLEDLADARIITKNLVYVIGLSASLANREKLSKWEYFGQYGNIIKIVVNKNKAYNQNSPHGPSYSAYVTFSKPSEASIAILSLDETMIDNHLIRASFGTTKYCSFFLKGIECNNKDCLYLHKFAEDADIIKRGDLSSNRTIFAEQHSYAIKIADIYNPEVKKKLLNCKKEDTVFPSPGLIYKSSLINDNDPTNFKNNHRKKYHYSNIDYEDDFEDDEEEDEEYVLTYSKTNYKTKKYDKKNNASCDTKRNNNKSYKGENKEEEKLINQFKKKKKIFSNRETSRFNFSKKNIINNSNNNNNLNNSTNNANINVPEHILKLINNKITLHNLTKHMDQILIDKVLLDESVRDDKKSREDDWTQFINDNLENFNANMNMNNGNQQKDELLGEFEKINNFILDKIAYHKLNKNINK